MLSSMGVEVVDERPYELDGLKRRSFIYEFGLKYSRAMPEESRDPHQDTLRAIWAGRHEIDGFNALVLQASLTCLQANVLRSLPQYLLQGRTPFALDYLGGGCPNKNQKET